MCLFKATAAVYHRPCACATNGTISAANARALRVTPLAPPPCLVPPGGPNFVPICMCVRGCFPATVLVFGRVPWCPLWYPPVIGSSYVVPSFPCHIPCVFFMSYVCPSCQGLILCGSLFPMPSPMRVVLALWVSLLSGSYPLWFPLPHAISHVFPPCPMCFLLSGSCPRWCPLPMPSPMRFLPVQWVSLVSGAYPMWVPLAHAISHA